MTSGARGCVVILQEARVTEHKKRSESLEVELKWAKEAVSAMGMHANAIEEKVQQHVYSAQRECSVFVLPVQPS